MPEYELGPDDNLDAQLDNNEVVDDVTYVGNVEKVQTHYTGSAGTSSEEGE